MTTEAVQPGATYWYWLEDIDLQRPGNPARTGQCSTPSANRGHIDESRSGAGVFRCGFYGFAGSRVRVGRSGVGYWRLAAPMAIAIPCIPHGMTVVGGQDRRAVSAKPRRDWVPSLRGFFVRAVRRFGVQVLYACVHGASTLAIWSDAWPTRRRQKNAVLLGIADVDLWHCARKLPTLTFNQLRGALLPHFLPGVGVTGRKWFTQVLGIGKSQRDGLPVELFGVGGMLLACECVLLSESFVFERRGVK